MDDKVKPCPFCGVPVNYVRGNIWGWHGKDCFFRFLNEKEVDLTQKQSDDEYIKAWNRRANNG